MTTTVTVSAHCDDETRVKIDTQHENGEEQIILEDGESWEGVVYDDHEIRVREVKVGE